MTALDLLTALCETDAEDYKYCHYNQNGSLNRLMLEGTWMGGFTLKCGEPEEGALYLMVDVTLKDLKPDLIYVHKGDTFEASMFGYRIEDAISDKEAGGVSLFED